VDETLSVRQPAQEPQRARPEPPSKRRASQQVTYTVARGGTLLNVANLYKLSHDEVIALNPEIEPDRDLAPNTEVVVYAGGDERSESVGLPHDGSIVGAMPMPNGPGRRVTAERWKTWGSRSTIRQLDRVLARWAKAHPDWPEVLVGNISRRGGGPIEPHKTHQSGRDVDLGYVSKPNKEGRGWQKMNAANLDAEKTWALMQAFISEANVEVIYADRKLQHLLLKAARKRPRARADQLRQWFEVAPGARRGETLIRHIPAHDDHFHVRFACDDAERQCRS
jgi:murein endopeptidase